MRPGEPPTEESSEKLFYDLFFSRIEAKNENCTFYNKPEKHSENKLVLSASVIEQEGTWILTQKEDWSLVTLSIAARGKAKANMWMQKRGRQCLNTYH